MQYGELLLDKLAALTGAPGASAAQLPAQLRPLLFGRHDAADVVQRIVSLRGLLRVCLPLLPYAGLGRTMLCHFAAR